MAKKTQTPPKSFEDALAELERIVTEIEEGQIGLEESLVRQERGQFLLQYCRGVLDKAEQQIQMLSKAADGDLQVSRLPANPAAASLPANIENEEKSSDDASSGDQEAS